MTTTETIGRPAGSPTQPSATAIRRRKNARRARGALRSTVYVVVALILGIGLWQGAVQVYNPPRYIIPPPSSVWQSLVDLLTTGPSVPGSMWPQLGSTMEGTLLGFVVGGAAGIVLGILAGEIQLARRLLYPYLVAIQSVPKVALVPVFATWFGFGLVSKVSLVVTLVFFPVLVNTLQGVVMSDPDQIDLLRSLSANRWQRLWHIRIPGALPLVFTGLELGVVFAFLGSILSEIQGAQSGLGVMLAQFQTNADTEATFALLVIMAILGFILNTAMRLIHKRVVFWEADGAAQLRTTTQNG